MSSKTRSRTQSENTGNARGLFVAFLLLLVWLPIPWASNLPVTWALMEVGVYLMSALWLIQYARGRVVVTDALRQARPLLILFALWLGYGLMQMLPLPASVVGTLSPNTAALYAQAQRAPQLAGQDLIPNPEIRALPTLVELTEPGEPPGVNAELPRFDIATTQPIRLTLDLSASLTAWLKSLAYVLIFVLTLLLVDSAHRVKTLAYVLVLSGLGQAVYGALDVALAGGGVATGSFVNRNHFAAYLVLCLAAGIGLLIASMAGRSHPGSWRDRLQRIGELILSAKAPLRIFLAIMVIALVLTHSRMGNTAFFASLLITGTLALILFKDRPRPVVLLIASLIVIDIVIIGSWVGIERVKERIGETSLAQETRDEVDVYSLMLWQDYPVFGAGAGSYYGVFPRYKGADVGDSLYDHAHNDYLEFLTEYGLVGILLIGGVIVISLWNATLALRRRHSTFMRGIAFTAVMAITAMLIHATVEFNLQIPAYAATQMVILALTVLSRHLESESTPHPGPI